LGTGKGVSNKEIIKLCEEITDLKIKVNYTSRRPGDPPILFAKAKKAKELLKWEAKYSIKSLLLRNSIIPF